MAIYLLSNKKSYISYWKSCVIDAITIDRIDSLTQDDVLIVDDQVYKSLSNLDAKIFVLSNEPTFEECMVLMKDGIKAYGNIYMHTSHILSAIESLKDGKIWIYPDFLTQMMTLSNKQSDSGYENKLTHLTSREKDITRLIMDAYTNKEIAIKLDISVNTIKIHTKNIYHKLNVTDRLSLFSYLK